MGYRYPGTRVADTSCALLLLCESMYVVLCMMYVYHLVCVYLYVRVYQAW